MSLDLTGVWTALAVPMKDTQPDFDGWRNLISYQLDHGVTGLVVNGTTGESATLTVEEKVKLVEIALEVSAGKGRVMVGSGATATAESVELTKRFAALKPHSLMVVTPAYNKPTPAGLKAHYAAICQAAGDTPVVLYNVPGRTACNMGAETVAAIAQANSNVVAIKDASGSIWQMTENLRLAPQVALLCGDDGLTLSALAIGAVGAVSVVSNIAPALCAELQSAWHAGNLDRARQVHVQLQPLIDACFMESSPTPVKWGLKLLGMGDGSVRLPLAITEDATRERMASLMQDCALLS